MAGRNGEVQRLLEEPLPHHVRVPWPTSGELQVGTPTGDERGTQSVVGVLEAEADPRVLLAERGDDVRHEPGAQGELEGNAHGAGLGIDQLLGGGQAVVEGVQHGVDVTLEDAAGVRGLQEPARAQQQRGADLSLEPLQTAGDSGLADLVELGDLGDGGTVRYLLEVAQRFGVHDL